jgi:5-methylcytosine-specific restriction enzyme A
MPRMPGRPCKKPGCGGIAKNPGKNPYCCSHEDLKKQRFERPRGKTAARGYGGRWRKVREIYLSANPLCVMCKSDDVIEPAKVVDHKIPHAGPNDKLFWDETNFQALCKCHHDIKTSTEDGGFGRSKVKHERPKKVLRCPLTGVIIEDEKTP